MYCFLLKLLLLDGQFMLLILFKSSFTFTEFWINNLSGKTCIPILYAIVPLCFFVITVPIRWTNDVLLVIISCWFWFKFILLYCNYTWKKGKILDYILFDTFYIIKHLFWNWFLFFGSVFLVVFDFSCCKRQS